jgi:predicted AlkP superfamily phosphohydrolase/phosphomutase
VEGREPEGTIRPGEYDGFRNELAGRIEAMVDHQGRLLNNKAYKPVDLYKTVNGIPPDLIVYFGDLRWRSVGTVGFDDIYTFENDTGPDDANHDYYGVFIMDDRTGRGGQQLHRLHLMDVAPTVLDLFGQPVPEDMQGRIIG